MMSVLTKKYKRKFYEEDQVYHMAEEPSKTYSDSPQI